MKEKVDIPEEFYEQAKMIENIKVINKRKRNVRRTK